MVGNGKTIYSDGNKDGKKKKNTDRNGSFWTIRILPNPQ